MQQLSFFLFLFLLFFTLPCYAKEKTEDFSSKIEGKELRDYVLLLFHRDPKIREKSWTKLIALGPSLIKPLEELSNTSSPQMKRVLKRLLEEIYFKKAQKMFSPPPAFQNQRLINQLQSTSGNSKKQEILEGYREKLLGWIYQLKGPEEEKIKALQNLHREGMLISHSLEEILMIQRGSLLAYLLKRLWEWEFQYWKKDFEKYPQHKKLFWESGYLLEPFLRTLGQTGSVREKEWAREALTKIAKGYIKDLQEESYPVRQGAYQALFRLGDSAIPSLKENLSPSSANTAYWCQRLLFQIKWKLSPSLWEKLGPLLKGYETASYRKRRAILYQLEKVGAKEAIPSLRVALEQEKSGTLKIFAAQCLSRLGDQEGFRYLQKITLQELRAAAALAAIYMEQGVKDLESKNYQKAQENFLRVLKLQPENTVAYYNMACVYAQWKKLDKAFFYLEKAIRKGFLDLDHMEKDADLDNLRDDPRYKQLYKLADQLKRLQKR